MDTSFLDKVCFYIALVFLAEPVFAQDNVEDAWKTSHIVPVCVYSYPISLKEFTCRDYKADLVDRICYNRANSQLAIKPHSNDNYMLHCNIKVIGDNIITLLHSSDSAIDEVYNKFRGTLTKDNECKNPWRKDP